MKHAIYALALLASGTAVPATADNIDFGQFGPELAFLSSPLRGTTNDGVGFTLVFYGTVDRRNAGSSWGGSFQNGRELLRAVPPGQMIFYFDQSLTSLNSIAVEPTWAGAYTATLNGYASGALVTTSTYTYTGYYAGLPGTIGDMAITGWFDSATVSTTRDFFGFAVGGVDAIPLQPPVGGVPEPASWALMIAGFGIVGMAQRRRSRAFTA